MKKLLLSLIAASLWTMQGTAQQQFPKVVDKDGNSMDMPLFDSPEANNIATKRCGTWMKSTNSSSQIPSRAVSSSQDYVKSTGRVVIPVILVQFKDVQFTVNSPKQAFDQFFNGTTQHNLGNGNQHNYGSVAQYFAAMSSNAFTPVFKVYGPVTLDNDETYYGGTSSTGNDEKPQQVISDAIAKLQASDDAIADATEFCNGGSTIDCVYILYAGLGQNIGGANTTIWAKTGGCSQTLLGKRIRWYSMASELSGLRATKDSVAIAGIGVSCHEFSHALGLPDIYPSVGTSTGYAKDNQNMEYWDLMDGGEYTYNRGYCPTAYTAWEKEQLNWLVTIKTLSDDQQVTMTSSTEQGGTAYKIVNPSNNYEYFMLENIQKKGWNSHQYAAGLMVYHVNEPSNGTIHMGSHLNDIKGYPGMAIVPADGLCATADLDANHKKVLTLKGDSAIYYFEQMRGDLFPGTYSTLASLNVTELSDANAQPNWHWYKSGNSGYEKTHKALRNITYDTSTGIVSFNYIHDTTTGIKGFFCMDTSTKRIYTLDGRYVGQDFNALPHGIYITGGRKIVK